MGIRVEQVKEIQKGTEKLLGGNGYIYYIDCDDGFLKVDIYQNVLNCTLKLCGLLYVNYAGRKV